MQLYFYTTAATMYYNMIVNMFERAYQALLLIIQRSE